MKKFLKFAAIAVAAFALLSCEKDPQDGDTQKPGGSDTPGQTTPEYTENLTFTLEVTEAEADQAKIKVAHNGTTKDTWYGFATTESDIQKAIADVLAEGNVTLKKNTKTTVTVRNLEPETEYTFIAVGIKADGTTYGEPATVKFTTAKGEVEYAENAAWAITYIGDYEQQGQTYTHVAVLESTDQNSYFLTAWPKEAFEQTGIKTVAETEIASWLDYLSGSQYTFADILTVGNTMETFAEVIDTQYGLEWYIIAIGADEEGNATGHYAMSDLITIVEEDMTEEYAAWLGDWTFTGANGVAFDVTMKKGVANTTYKLAGWEGPESEGLDITVEWMAEQGIWVISAQKLGTYSFGNAGNGDIWFVPEDTDGYIYPSEGVPACLGGMTEDGERIVIGYSEEFEDGTSVAMNSMLYLVGLEADPDNWYTLTSTEVWPTFPLTVTPATKATTYAVKEFKGGKKTLNPLAPKTFKTFGICDMSVRTF